jgi:AcrR family transcriptional regulator
MRPDLELRRKILEEAIGLLAREGPQRMTMRALGERIGHSAASIYQHFGSKEELELEIGYHGFARLWDALAPALALDDPREALAESMRRYMEFGIENRELYRLMFQDLTSLRDESFRSDPRLERFRQAIISVYERGARQGVFRPCDPELETAVGWVALHGYVLFVSQGHLPDPAFRSHPPSVAEALIEERLRALEP